MQPGDAGAFFQHCIFEPSQFQHFAKTALFPIHIHEHAVSSAETSLRRPERNEQNRETLGERKNTYVVEQG